MPALRPVVEEDEGLLPGEEKRKLTDPELVKLDLVKVQCDNRQILYTSENCPDLSVLCWGRAR